MERYIAVSRSHLQARLHFRAGVLGSGEHAADGHLVLRIRQHRMRPSLPNT